MPIRQGEVLEWLKRHAWKACNRQNRFAGSNPVLSAGRRIQSYEAKPKLLLILFSPQFFITMNNCLLAEFLFQTI